VEGLEEVSYITTELHLAGLWDEFRRLGCYLIPANKKSNLIQPLAIATEMSFPIFVIFDADGDIQNVDQRRMHELDNRALISLLGATHASFPAENIFQPNHVIWKTNFGDAVKADFGTNYDRFANAARARYANEGGLEKHDLFIAEWVSAARAEGLVSGSLDQVCQAILSFARAV